MNPRAGDAARYCQSRMLSVEGYFAAEDAWAFVAVDELQRRLGVGGDLLEVGAYLGKSAILLGYMADSGETVQVCDPFDAQPSDVENAAEQQRFYGNLTRDRFEQNYRRFHDRDPDVRVGFSGEVLPTLPPHGYRFIHVDGSHSYDVVRGDVACTSSLLCSGGIVAFDDMLSRHTPGVPAAVWHAVIDDGLIPLAMTNKLYATWAQHPIVDELHAALEASAEVEIVDEHFVVGHRVLELGAVGPEGSRTRRLLKGLTPPALVHAVRRIQSRGNRA